MAVDAGLGATTAVFSDSAVFMDTLVAIEVVGDLEPAAASARTRAALGWFAEVERVCSRFDEASELVALCRRPRVPVAVSPLLFHVLEVAVAVAQASRGAFDPTLGGRLRASGFDQNHRGGTAPDVPADPRASYRDVVLQRRGCTVTLTRPLLLDLGGVAKGFAIDLAAAELAPIANFAINAGGDLFFSGVNTEAGLWRAGIRDPADPGCIITAFALSGSAVCTSAGYERPRLNGDGNHVVIPASSDSPPAQASVTVVAPSAALADALSTAALVLGPRDGLRLLERECVEGLWFTPDRRVLTTPGFPRRST